jgi:4-amino-4-deoxy-L-arabinose transferase-like glycosyltransferase
VAATLTVFFAFSTLRRYVGEPRAFVAALLLPVSFLWLEKTPSAEIDMLQVAWVTASLFSFLRAFEARESGFRRSALRWWTIALLCVAGGFLTKWTAPAFFYLAIVPFLAWQRRAGWLVGWDHLLAAGIAGAVCVAWAALVANEVGWNLLRETVFQEAAQRFAPRTAGKPYPWVESIAFPAVVLVASLPWSLPALAALRPQFQRTRVTPERRVLQLFHCWAWPNLVFWSLPAQHNVRYVLPISPAITLLGVLVVHAWIEAKWRNPLVRKQLIAAILVAWVAVKVVHVEVISPKRVAHRNARETGTHLAALVPEGQILYLCRLKDEGILFYYERPACRLESLIEAPSQCVYVLVLDSEWAECRMRAEHVAELRDQQQAPIHLIRLHPANEGQTGWPALPIPIRPASSASAP